MPAAAPKLLVVDDNSTVRRVVKLVFEGEGIAVTATQGARAFEQIKSDPPDIILADEAQHVVTRLKNHPELSRIPVVLLKNAFGSVEDNRMKDADYDGVLVKPLQPEKMIDCVRALLGRSDGTAEFAAVVTTFPAAVERSEPARDGKPKSDRDLTLDEYFDRLDEAFGGSGTPDWAIAPSRPEVVARHPATTGASVMPAQPAGLRAVAAVKAATTAPNDARPVITDDFVEEVARRVMDRLSDRVVRQTVTEVVARLAKWLVTDEIEKSKPGAPM